MRPNENHELSPLIDPFLSYFTTETLGAFSNTCSLFRKAFKKTLATRKRNEILRQIVCGEELRAKKMLEDYPNQLKDSQGEAEDYSGRKIKNLTPFQAALCAGDVDMCKMIKEIFLAHPDKTGGEAEMIWQFVQIFPKKRGDSSLFPEAAGGLTGHFKRQEQACFSFSTIVTAINKASLAEVIAALGKEGAQFTETDEARGKPDDVLTLMEALNRFREQFTQKSYSERVRSQINRCAVRRVRRARGLVMQEPSRRTREHGVYTDDINARLLPGEIIFNPQCLLNAFTVYESQFDAWCWNKRNLFWCQVIGFAQRFLPACDAQAIAEGLLVVVENDRLLQRSFDLICGHTFYPINFDSCSNLGFDHAVLGVMMIAGGIDKGTVSAIADAFKKLCQAKIPKLEGLINSSLVSPAIVAEQRNFS